MRKKPWLTSGFREHLGPCPLKEKKVICLPKKKIAGGRKLEGFLVVKFERFVVKSSMNFPKK